jgi:hypothetical protein
MNAKNLIEAVGGRKKVMELTGLSRGRISQWVTGNDIPVAWLKFFQAQFPRLDWKSLLPDVVSEAMPPPRRRSTDRRLKSTRT